MIQYGKRLLQYKVPMNSLFGLNHKENKNIDNIEMSDSEDDDEDEDDIIYQKSKS